MRQENKINLSIVIPVFNEKNFIIKLFEEIKTFFNDSKNEIIFIDDGSTDDTYEKLLELSEKNKNITLFRNEENIGLTKSLNVLIKNSNGKILGRQDGDDISLPNRISTQYNYLNYFMKDLLMKKI